MIKFIIEPDNKVMILLNEIQNNRTKQLYT